LFTLDEQNALFSKDILLDAIPARRAHRAISSMCFLTGECVPQKIMDQVTFAHNYGYVVGDLMGIDHDHAKRCFQLLTTFFAVHIKYGML
jgi:hypothetical protein